MPYTFDAAALREANGGRLPAESQGFTRKHSGNNQTEMHNREDALHRLIVDQQGNIVGETVFIPRYNANGQRVGAEASLVAAVNDPRFSVSIDQGQFSVSGPEGAVLRTIDARDARVRVDRTTNRVTVVGGGELTTVPEAAVIPPRAAVGAPAGPGQYTPGAHYDYHAYLYLPRGSEPNPNNPPTVSRVLLRETNQPPPAPQLPPRRTGIVGEVYISEGSADLTLDYERPMHDPLKFIQSGGHNRVTFVGFEGNNPLQTQIVGGRPSFRSPDNAPHVQFQGAPATLDVAFATRTPAGGYESTLPYRVIAEGEIVNRSGQPIPTGARQQQEFANEIEHARIRPRRAPAPQPPARRKDAPPEEMSALPPEAAAEVTEAAALFNRGITDPDDMPAARPRGTHHLAV